MLKIYKYPTGAEIPEGAIYLKTVVQKEALGKWSGIEKWEKCWLVWHYFLVPQKPKQKSEQEEEAKK